MKHVPFWVDDYPRPQGMTSELPNEADVVVVGSGFTGLSAALRLSEAGRSVAVIDADEIAGGASSINGGMVSPDIKGGVGAVEARHGPELAGGGRRDVEVPGQRGEDRGDRDEPRLPREEAQEEDRADARVGADARECEARHRAQRTRRPSTGCCAEDASR